MTKSEKTKIVFDYNGKHYTLEYTANSLKKLERQGVNFSKLDDMIFTAPETLFRGAFIANHPAEDRATINKNEATLFNRPYFSLFAIYQSKD